MKLMINDTLEDYQRFLAIRQLPSYSFRGCWAEFPDEFIGRVTGESATILRLRIEAGVFRRSERKHADGGVYSR